MGHRNRPPKQTRIRQIPETIPIGHNLQRPLQVKGRTEGKGKIPCRKTEFQQGLRKMQCRTDNRDDHHLRETGMEPELPHQQV